MRAASTAKSTSRPTASASSASASTRCRMRSRSWRGSGCSIVSTRWRSGRYELIYTNRFGQEIWREPRGTDAGYDVPQFSIHRGRLQGVIYHAVRARLGESRIHTGHRLGAFRQDESGVTAYFFDRHGGAPPHRAWRRADRRRRHQFLRARGALSERGTGALERHHAVARRDRMAGLSHRPLDDRGRAAWRRSSSSIRSPKARAPTGV